MRTTIQLPDELLRRVKSAAALRGVKLKDFVASMLERGLAEIQSSESSGHRRLPVMIPATGRKMPALSNSEIASLLDEEDDEVHGRLS